MKAVISNRIYYTPTKDQLDLLKKELTYRIRTPGASRGGKHMMLEIIRNYKILPNGIVTIPRGREDLLPPDIEIIDKRITVDMPFTEPKKVLRPGQQLVYDEINDSCFINALVGWGKTFVALYIARKLGQKTLIVTHNTMLRDQWVEEIKDLYDNMSVGLIGTGKFDTDHVLVVGNIQTLAKHALTLSKEFGTIILDEAHHCPASTFTSMIDTSYARYRIALSGTMIRRDGKHVLFRDFFGDTVYKPPQSDTVNPKVKIIKPGIILTPNATWTQKVNDLMYSEDYQNFIVSMAKIQMSKGHSVLIIADRVEFLSNVCEKIGDSCMLVTGGVDFEERKKITRQIDSGEKLCIAGSRQIFSEGISINRLSCVILTCPIAQEALLEQVIGRIMRPHPDKPKEPEVLDIQFSGSSDKKQNNLRLGFYMNKGWKVETM